MTRAPYPNASSPVLADSLRREWAELVNQVGASPFVHPGWVSAWAASRRVDFELVRVRRDGDLVGALPLVRSREGAVTPTDWHTPLFEAAALDDRALRELAQVTVGRGHRYLRLGFLDANGPTHRAFTGELESAGYRLRERTVLRSPYIRLAGTWDDYLAGWPSKKRSDLRRRKRRLEEQGEVTLDVYDGRERLHDLLTEGFAVEASGWKGREGTAIVSEGTEGLYRDAAEWAASEGKLQLGFLRLDGRAIAFDYCFETDEVHYLVKTGFHPDFSAFAPGKLLRAFMLERAFAMGTKTYDFVGDNDTWKLEWTDQVRPTVVIHAYSRGPLGWIAQAANLIERGARWAGRRLKRLFR